MGVEWRIWCVREGAQQQGTGAEGMGVRSIFTYFVARVSLKHRYA